MPTSTTTSISGLGQTVVTLSFAGSFTRSVAGALTDGYYQRQLVFNVERMGY